MCLALKTTSINLSLWIRGALYLMKGKPIRTLYYTKCWLIYILCNCQTRIERRVYPTVGNARKLKWMSMERLIQISWQYSIFFLELLLDVKKYTSFVVPKFFELDHTINWNANFAVNKLGISHRLLRDLQKEEYVFSSCRSIDVIIIFPACMEFMLWIRRALEPEMTG